VKHSTTHTLDYTKTGGDFKYAVWRYKRIWTFKRCYKSKALILPGSKCYVGRSYYVMTFMTQMETVKGAEMFYLTPEQYTYEILVGNIK
jgi:hypothetical protein